MKLKINQIKTLHDAFSSLDGYQRAVKVDGAEKLIFQPYTLSGKTRYAIAKNLRILGSKITDFNKARDGLITEISGGQTFIKKEDTEKIETFVTKVNELAEVEDEVDGLLSVTPAELGLELETDLNPFPSNVINGLTLLIK